MKPYSTKTVNIPKAKTVGKTVKKLKKGKKYYFRVRAYKQTKVSNTTQINLGSWSNVRSAKIK